MRLTLKVNKVCLMVIVVVASLLLPAYARLSAHNQAQRSSHSSLLIGSWAQTSQADFQTGQRWGVDTYETPGSLTLLPLNDNFDGDTLNLDRWKFDLSGSVAITQSNGVLQIVNQPVQNQPEQQRYPVGSRQ